MVQLRPLPYPPNELEPTVDEETVLIHHDVHQASYVKGWNERKSPAFNGSGVILHEMYWENLCRRGASPPPSPQFLSAVARQWSSLQAMASEMVQLGRGIQGSGWVVLTWVPRFQQLVVLPISIHQDGWIPTAVPLLVIDVWEHAYYLKYHADRATYLHEIWNNVNWGVVSRRFAEAVR